MIRRKALRGLTSCTQLTARQIRPETHNETRPSHYVHNQVPTPDRVMRQYPTRFSNANLGEEFDDEVGSDRHADSVAPFPHTKAAHLHAVVHFLEQGGQQQPPACYDAEKQVARHVGPVKRRKLPEVVDLLFLTKSRRSRKYVVRADCKEIPLHLDVRTKKAVDVEVILAYCISCLSLTIHVSGCTLC